MLISVQMEQTLIIFIAILFTSSFATSSTSTCELASNVLTISPSFAVAKEGDAVTFSCTAKGAETHFISWNINPDMNNTNVSVAYDQESRNMVSNIIVHVGRTVQFIRCDLRPDVDSRACFSSPMSKLRVQYFPHKNDISCGPHDPKPFHEGDAMPISCEVQRSTPAVDMRWSLLPDATIISLSPHHDGIWNRGLLHDLPIAKSLHMKRLVC